MRRLLLFLAAFAAIPVALWAAQMLPDHNTGPPLLTTIVSAPADASKAPSIQTKSTIEEFDAGGMPVFDANARSAPIIPEAPDCAIETRIPSGLILTSTTTDCFDGDDTIIYTTQTRPVYFTRTTARPIQIWTTRHFAASKTVPAG